ncbi:hypothetical protein DL767_008033 [Monosporascus sp. MG133]|nr:hypothetical protein DL767_008033 [Monosporascus sp. MG133]
MAKKNSQKRDASSSSQIKDARFANFESNPRFKLPSKNRSKTTIDKRFSRMLKDEDFTASTKVDRYGRKLKSDNKKRALKNIYREEDEDDEGDEDEDKDKDAVVEDDAVVERELQKADAKYDPARGGGFSSSESESDSDEEEDEGEAEAEVEASAGMQRLQDAQVDVETGEVTKRIAIVNLDWDHIKSTDLMALFSSFVPKGGRIERISIYPSEFGKERMQREELEGPPREIFKKSNMSQGEAERDSEDESDVEDNEEDEEDEEDDEKIKKEIIKEGGDEDFDSDALRAYQLDRLRYYYAVMVCSDTNTAQKIYEATDGTEYQSSSNFIDLRFIPDDVTFEDEPRDECDQVGPDYKPTEFITDALQHSKVKLTWDMHPEEVARRENIKRVFTGSRSELEENDMRAYLASDSEDEDGPAEETEGAGELPKLTKKELKAQKMRELLGLGSEPLVKLSKSGPVGEVQVTFTPALMGGDDSKKKQEPEEETTLEKYMRKERERKAKKKEKVLAKRHGVDPDAEQEDEPAQEDGEDLGFDDPFFTAEEPVKTHKSSERKEERRRKREAKEAETAKNAAQRAQLKEIMRDETQDAAGRLGHFDINEIRRAEKQKAKKHKKKKGKKGAEEEEDRAGLQEGFHVDVSDDRFSKLFRDEKFAIDPSHPQFKATEGMKQILEEGRKKRKAGADEELDEDRPPRHPKEGSSKKQKVKGPPNDDLASLVESVRRKAKSKKKDD